MNKVMFRKGNLFDQKGPNKILVHACNCKGVWGSGIAPEFAERFPFAFNDYMKLCKVNSGKYLPGMGLYHENLWSDEQMIGYLFTSYGYGKFKDSEAQILKNTFDAVTCLLNILPDNVEIHSPRINSGRFGVPWEHTEAIINECLKAHPNRRWVVWSL